MAKTYGKVAPPPNKRLHRVLCAIILLGTMSSLAYWHWFSYSKVKEIYTSAEPPTTSCSLPQFASSEMLPEAQDEQKTFSLSEKDAARPKYLVGCDLEGWSNFVLRENHFFLSSLIDSHGWKEIPANLAAMPSKLLQEKNRPLVLMFCFHELKEYPKYPLARLRELGTMVIHFTDDLQDHNMYEKDYLMSQLLMNTDIFLNTYAYRQHIFLASVTKEFQQKWPDKPLPKRLWHPHSAIKDFTDVKFNTTAVNKIFISGARSKLTYPLRQWFWNTFGASSQVTKLKHPGYFKLQKSHTADYARAINAHQAAFTSTSSYRYVVAKIFEIPATGSLLLVNLDLEHVFQALGFINMVHYVGYNDDDPTPMIKWVLEPSNARQIWRIRKKGQDLVLAKHTPALRAKAVDEYVTKRKITNKLPSSSTRDQYECPCPVAGIESVDECLSNYYHNGYAQPGSAKPISG